MVTTKLDLRTKTRLLKKIFMLAAFAFSCAAATAQATVKLSGRITDSESGSPVTGASVVIGETRRGVSTDVEGRFFIQIDANKKYTLIVSSIGYNTKSIPDVDASIADGLNIQLDRKTSQTSITVKSSVRRESIASVYAIQKNSSSISDGISSEAIKRSPDKNTGEVLKRVSGASVQDNKFVVIRGLSERYNVSLLNNSILPSTEADKKAFAFDIIPSSVVDNLVIYKSPTPDLPGDFSGGAIKISTQDYPARKISELGLSIGYNSLTTGKNFYKSYPDGSFDQLGFFDNSRLIPGAYYKNRNGFVLNSTDFKRNVTKMFPNTFGYEAVYQSLPTININYAGGNTVLLKNNNKLGYVFTVGYSNGRSASDRNRSEFDIVKRNLYNYGTNNYDEKNNLSAMLGLTYSYGKNKISFKTIFNNTFVKDAGIRNGTNYENGANSPFYIKSANSEATQNGLSHTVLEGLHKLSDGWSLDWNASFGYTYRNQPDQRILSFRSPENDNVNYYLKLSNENSPEIRNAGRVYSFLDEFIYGASANITRQFRWFGQDQKLKIGTMNYLRNRNVEVDALGYATLDFFGVTIPETKNTTFNTIFSPANIDNYNLTVANIETNSTDYTANAMANSGYVMLDNKFSEQVKLTWGARVERYRQELAARGKATRVYEQTDVLPSLLFTYALNAKTNLRAAASQAVNRPEFRELADYSVFDYDNYVVVRGNPDLQRCKNTNIDLRYEWFPAAGEIISASLFYKYFTDPIEQVNKGNDVLSYENADHATAYGAEIELRKKMDFIGGRFFDHLTFYTNASYIKGSVQFNGQTVNSPLQGQSPYLVNAGLTYATDNGWSVNALYNRIGPRLKFRSVGSGALDIFEKPRDVIDLQVGKKMLKNKLEMKLTVSDVLAQAAAWYYKYEANPANTNYSAANDKIINSIRYGTTASVSLRYNLGK